ncbi:DUF6226 family protein [Agrococcus pavilionensis]|uniref:DUF6226 family protein n=1 Tax=Agrococcus pavilionensis TaxID=1346502 RepID=UPI00039BFA16|nr:DUF6226 family protein [Agrococcus pavilionensis]
MEIERFALPPIARREILGDDARPIPYGSRWGLGAPPEDAYGVASHKERYAPLRDVADALVAHVLATRACSVEERPLERGELRALTLRAAAGAGGAPRLTAVRLAWTDFPGVTAELGRDVPDAAPICGCDACDEDVVVVAESFVDVVLRAVADWPRRAS